MVYLESLRVKNCDGIGDDYPFSLPLVRGLDGPSLLSRVETEKGLRRFSSWR